MTAGVLRQAKDGVRLLGKGEIKTKAEFTVARASASAIAAVGEALGGTVIVTVPPKAAKSGEAAEIDR